MAIKLDISQTLVIAYCEDCGKVGGAFVWSSARFSTEDAHDSAVAHEETAHPGARQAHLARDNFHSRRRTRHAA